MPRKRRLFWIVSLISLFLAFPIFVWAGDWKSGALIDGKGKLFYSASPYKQLPPASTVKILTAMVVIDSLPLDKWIRISKMAASIEPSKVYLRAGEYYRVRDLLYALLMASANDAAVALAEAAAGTESRFARFMNKKAKRCGLHHSVFKNASGLPAKGQFSCAYDLARLMRIAVKYGLITDALGKKVYVFYSRTGRKIKVVNHNKLLWNKRWSFIRGKTGFTRSARQCFVGYFYRKAQLYTFAFLGGKTLWRNIKEIYFLSN